MTGLRYVERDTNEEKHLNLEGVFVRIGLVPSTAWLKDSGIELNERQDIIVDKFGSTNIQQVTILTAPTNKSLSPWGLVLRLLLEPLIT